MNNDEAQQVSKLRDKLNVLAKYPGGLQLAGRILMNLTDIFKPVAAYAIPSMESVNAIPPLGNIAAIAADIEQTYINGQTSEKLKELEGVIQKLLNEIQSSSPTASNLFNLLTEIAGEEAVAVLYVNVSVFIGIALSDGSRGELEPFVKDGFLKLTPTHSQLTLGAGNQIGDNIEDKKRPYGIGTTFQIQLMDKALSGI